MSSTAVPAVSSRLGESSYFVWELPRRSRRGQGEVNAGIAKLEFF